MSTTRETLRTLVKSIVTRLENRKAIQFPPRLRQIVQDEITHLISPTVLTDEDLKEKAIAQMGARSEFLSDQAFTETEQFRAAKAVVRKGFGDDVLHGFYFQKPLKHVADTMVQYFMRSSHIDDVYETDDDLVKQIVEIVQKFNARDAH